MRVCVVGGGAVGLGIAYELASAGAEVTLFERNKLGGGASRGNTGLIAPALCSIPVPAPGAVARALRWMLKANSPFVLHPRPSPALLAWLTGFRRACAPSRFAAGMAALAEHNRHAVDALLSWRSEGVEFELHEAGLIFAAVSQAALEEELANYSLLKAAGLPVEIEVLEGRALHECEPALSRHVVAGMLSRAEWHVRPETLTAGLAAALEPTAELCEDVNVTRMSQTKRGWRLATSAGSFQADRVVVATGIGASALLRPLGYRLPLQPAKGYSITATGHGPRPLHAIYLLEAKVACSPYAEEVRLAGLFELGSHDLSISRRRLRAITDAARHYLRWQPAEPLAEWTGLRPFAPDGLPVIGAIPRYDNLFISTGHGMAGITLSAISAKSLAPMVLGTTSDDELAPLSPARFVV